MKSSLNSLFYKKVKKIFSLFNLLVLIVSIAINAAIAPIVFAASPQLVCGNDPNLGVVFTYPIDIRDPNGDANQADSYEAYIEDVEAHRFSLNHDPVVYATAVNVNPIDGHFVLLRFPEEASIGDFLTFPINLPETGWTTASAAVAGGVPCEPPPPPGDDDDDDDGPEGPVGKFTFDGETGELSMQFTLGPALPYGEVSDWETEANFPLFADPERTMLLGVPTSATVVDIDPSEGVMYVEVLVYEHVESCQEHFYFVALPDGPQIPGIANGACPEEEPEEAVCGDNIIQWGAGESCDAGNTDSGDGCDDLCHIEGDWCMQFDGDAAACRGGSDDIDCKWDPDLQECFVNFGQMNECSQFEDSLSCGERDDCFWDTTVGRCVQNFGYGYPDFEADYIFSFPQPFNNDDLALTDGDPYGLANRPNQMMQGAPRELNMGFSPVIVGFNGDSINEDLLINHNDYIKIYRFDDIRSEWININDLDGDEEVDLNPQVEFEMEDEGFTKAFITTPDGCVLDPNAYYRIAVSGVTDAEETLYPGQTNECPDGSGDLCYTSTFKTGTECKPDGGFQGRMDQCSTAEGAEDCNSREMCAWDEDEEVCDQRSFSCGPGDTFLMEFPYDGDNNISQDTMIKVRRCTKEFLDLDTVELIADMDGENEYLVYVDPWIDNGGSLIVDHGPLRPSETFTLVIGDTVIASFTTDLNNYNNSNGGMCPPPPMGDGILTVNLTDNEGNPFTSEEWIPVTIACGDFSSMMDQGPGEGDSGFQCPPENTFFMDEKLRPGTSELQIYGVPTPSTTDDESFANSCIVFLRPDMQGFSLGEHYTRGGGLLEQREEGEFEYLTNDPGEDMKPLPPGMKYAEVWFGDFSDPAHEERVGLTMSIDEVIPGDLSGIVCVNDDPESGNAEICGDGDTVLSNMQVFVHKMGGMEFGDKGFDPNNTDVEGVYSFSDMPGGLYMVEAWSAPGTNNFYNYFGSVTVDGETNFDLVISPGNILELTLDNTSECWDEESFMHYDFMPIFEGGQQFGFMMKPVMGELNIEDLVDNGDGTYTATLNGFGQSIYEGMLIAPGCKSTRFAGDLSFEFSEEENETQALDVELSAGITLTGQVLDQAGDPVANFPFGAKMLAECGMGGECFGGFTGSGTGPEGSFVMSGMYQGDWQFEAFDGNMNGSLYSFAPGEGSLSEEGTLTVTGEDGDTVEGITLVIRQDKRVNISITDGKNPVYDAGIDIECDSGKYVHLGHARGVWTYLPPGDTCSFNIFPRGPKGNFQPINNR